MEIENYKTKQTSLITKIDQISITTTKEKFQQTYSLLMLQKEIIGRAGIELIFLNRGLLFVRIVFHPWNTPLH